MLTEFAAWMEKGQDFFLSTPIVYFILENLISTTQLLYIKKGICVKIQVSKFPENVGCIMHKIEIILIILIFCDLFITCIISSFITNPQKKSNCV